MQISDMVVLLCDDSSMLRAIFKQSLVERGFRNFVEAANGEEAITLFKQHHPDLIFMDIFMPGIDGNETLRKIRLLDPKVPAVMVSSIKSQDLLMEASEIGVLDIIRKPWQPRDIDNMLKKIQDYITNL